jgi:hypothetical protein
MNLVGQAGKMNIAGVLQNRKRVEGIIANPSLISPVIGTGQALCEREMVVTQYS